MKFNWNYCRILSNEAQQRNSNNQREVDEFITNDFDNNTLAVEQQRITKSLESKKYHFIYHLSYLNEK